MDRHMQMHRMQRGACCRILCRNLASVCGAPYLAAISVNPRQPPDKPRRFPTNLTRPLFLAIFTTLPDIATTTILK